MGRMILTRALKNTSVGRADYGNLQFSVLD